MSQTSSLKKENQSWKKAWQQPSFRFQFLFFVIVITGIAMFFPRFFDYLEARDGAGMNDFIVSNLPPIDVSWQLFLILYTGALIGFACNIRYPKIFLITIQTYALVTLMRIITLYFIPLNPPEGYIPLKEPVITFLFTTNGKICSKDLFFSGHVSMILSFYFPLKQRLYRNILLLFSFMIGMLVLVQHVHYTIDVLVSFAATYVCYGISKTFLAKSVKGEV